ncbi:MAG: hypothetical protein HY554_15230 [Elusimicrobia bacterium]|nr:hypothetical protein [Elusimicrobiota bacterium]
MPAAASVPERRPEEPGFLRFASSWPPAWLLVFVSLAAAAVRVVLSLDRPLSYDCYLHAFIATQDRWHNVMMVADLHPISYYALLRLASFLGEEPLILRSIGICAGAVSAFLLGWSARKVAADSATAPLAATAYAFSSAAIDLSLDLRGYMLCLFFILLSFVFLLRTLELAERADDRAPPLFAVFAGAACATEHYGVLYAGAALGVLAIAAGSEPAFRGSLAAWARRCRPGLAAVLAVPPIVAYALYRPRALSLSVFGSQLGDLWPREGGSLVGFFLANLQKELNLFLPFPIASRALFLGLLALAAAAAVLAARRGPAGMAGLRRGAAPMILLVLLLELAGLSLARIYPFGGPMRHQSVIEPFLILSAFLTLDGLAAQLGSETRRQALFLVAALAVSEASYANAARLAAPAPPRGAHEYRVFERRFGRPRTVYVDRLSHVYLYAQTRDWRWTATRDFSRKDADLEFRLRKRGESDRFVIRSRKYSFDLAQAAAWKSIAHAIRRARRDSATLFLITSDRDTYLADARKRERLYRRRARSEGLEIEKSHIAGRGFFATVSLKER